MSRSRGQSILYAVLLMPTLVLVFALAVDIAGLHMQKLRLRYAVDLATVAAATAVDAQYYSRSGRLRLDPVVANATAREYLLRNLSGLPDVPDAATVAADADVTVINQLPGVDPYSGIRLDRPAVSARIRVPYRFSLLGWVGLRAVQLTIAADAEMRI